MQKSYLNDVPQSNFSYLSEFQNYDPHLTQEANLRLSSQETIEKDEALKIIFQTYLYKGADWKLIKSLIGEKHFKDPKNFVYNSLRKFSRVLQHYDLQTVQQKRKISKNNVIISLLEVVNHIQKEMVLMNKTLCQEESILFRMKKRILIYSLWESSFSNSEALQLLREIKITNLKLKSLGVFKAKQKRSWKITQKGYRLINSLDNSIKYERFETSDEIKAVEVQEKAEETEMKGGQVDLSDFYIDSNKNGRSLVEEANMFLGIEQKEEEWESFF